MDLNLTAEERQFRDELRAWLAAHVPHNWEHRRDESDTSMEAHFAFLKAWQRTLYDGGWAGISWPTAYGGRGASLMLQVIFWQELALAGAPPRRHRLGAHTTPHTIAYPRLHEDVSLRRPRCCMALLYAGVPDSKLRAGLRIAFTNIY